MKPLSSFFALCFFVTQFIACTKNASKPSATLPITASNIAGNFTIGSFTNSSNQTATFSGFVFTFNTNGTIVATNGNDLFNGNWKLDDGNSNEIKINFSAAPLNQLNGSWHISELTSNHLFLTDDVNDDASDDNPESHSSLEFERD